MAKKRCKICNKESKTLVCDACLKHEVDEYILLQEDKIADLQTIIQLTKDMNNKIKEQLVLSGEIRNGIAR